VIYSTFSYIVLSSKMAANTCILVENQVIVPVEHTSWCITFNKIPH